MSGGFGAGTQLAYPRCAVLYRVARLSQGAQSNARGRRAEQRTIANQKQRRAEQIENARYQLKRAAARDDIDAVEHWINRLSILGVKTSSSRSR